MVPHSWNEPALAAAALKSYDRSSRPSAGAADGTDLPAQRGLPAAPLVPRAPGGRRLSLSLSLSLSGRTAPKQRMTETGRTTPAPSCRSTRARIRLSGRKAPEQRTNMREPGPQQREVSFRHRLWPGRVPSDLSASGAPWALSRRRVRARLLADPHRLRGLVGRVQQGMNSAPRCCHKVGSS